MEPHRLITVKEYAEIKGVSVQYVYQLIKEKKIKHEKIGSVFLIRIDPKPIEK
jgi:excisionase family DNA binding protein